MKRPQMKSSRPCFQRSRVRTGSSGSRGNAAVMISAASAASSNVAGRNAGFFTRSITLESDDLRLDARRRHLEDADAWWGVAEYVARHLQPAPFEPSRSLKQARSGGHRRPLVHAARIE